MLDANGCQDYTIPHDFYTDIYDTIDYASDTKAVELYSSELLCMFEFYKINKIGGTASPYVSIEWPGNQIPMGITLK
jgi:hypothetical protein